MAKVSIIVPVLNGKNFIQECLNSLVLQTLKDIEIIVVDAGSTDGTLKVVEEYIKKDNRVRLVPSKKRSMGYQYNIGIDCAEGEYIGFCESDDYVAFTMYEQLYSIAKLNDLDYVRSDFEMFIDKEERLFLAYHILAGRKRTLYNRVIHPIEYPEIIHRDVNIWNGIYKKSYLEQEKIKQNETPGAAFQDMGFVIQTILTASRAMYVSVDANKYRKDNVNSSIYDIKGVVNVVNEFLYIKDIVKKKRIKSEEAICAIFTRSYHCFCGFYDKLPPYEKCSNDIKKNIQIFFREVKSMYNDIRYPLKIFSGIDSALSLERILADDIQGFDRLRRIIYASEVKRRKLFFEYIKKYKRTVLFGAGEVGCSTYAMLKKNDYEGECVFFDNSPERWGTALMGILLLSPEKILEFNDGNTIFVICVANGIEDIKYQLCNNGVSVFDICLSVAPIPHNAMEIDIN